MKKLLLILLCVPLIGLGQDVNERILLIKEMYKETNELLNKSGQSCKEIEEVEYDIPGDKYSRPYIKTIKYCNLDKGYSRITYEYKGDHYYEHEEYYFRYNTLYFSYRVNSDGPDDIKYRQYFNTDGELIRNLVDYGNGNKNIDSAPFLYHLHYSQELLLDDK